MAYYLGSDQGNVGVCLSVVARPVRLPMARLLFPQRFPDVRLRTLAAPYPVIESRLRDGRMDFYIGPAPALPPALRLLVLAESMLTLLTIPMASDAVAMTLRQYAEFPLTRGALQRIPIREPLPVPPIVAYVTSSRA